jgi:hypothetical protein
MKQQQQQISNGVTANRKQQLNSNRKQIEQQQR